MLLSSYHHSNALSTQRIHILSIQRTHRVYVGCNGSEKNDVIKRFISFLVCVIFSGSLFYLLCVPSIEFLCSELNQQNAFPSRNDLNESLCGCRMSRRHFINAEKCKCVLFI